MRENLDLAADQADVHGSLGTRPHEPGDAHHELVTQILRDGEHGGAIGIADDLNESLAVAQINEDDAAVVTASVYPAAHRDGLAKAFSVDATAVIGAFQIILRPAVWPRVRVMDRGRWCNRLGRACNDGPATE